MSLEWILFGLRLLATFILTIFLGVAFYLIWRQLRQTEVRQTAGSTRNVDQLRVIAAGEGQPLVVGQTLPLQPVMLLGRGPQYTIDVHPADASTGQVRLSWRDDRWWLENLGQSESIKLNDGFLSAAQPLAHGDVISMGDTQLCFETAQ